MLVYILKKKKIFAQPNQGRAKFICTRTQYITGKFLFLPISRLQILVPARMLKASSCSAQGFRARSHRTVAPGSRQGARTLSTALMDQPATGGLKRDKAR